MHYIPVRTGTGKRWRDTCCPETIGPSGDDDWVELGTASKTRRFKANACLEPPFKRMELKKVCNGSTEITESLVLVPDYCTTGFYQFSDVTAADGAVLTPIPVTALFEPYSGSF